MKSTFLQRVMLSILGLFLLTYAGFQVYRYMNSQYKTETAYTYTVSESKQVTGMLLRDEMILEERVGSGVATYIPSDGAKVSTGSVIAEIYRDEDDAENIHRLRTLEKQRGMLEKAQDPGTTSFAHTDVLNKQISSELGSVIDVVNSESLSDLQTSADKLLVLMNTKQIATGKQENFNDTIEKIQAEETYCSSKISNDPREITSPRPGYFMRNIDGFEGKVDLKALDTLSGDTLFNLMNQPVKTRDNRVGKLMIGHKWYYAVLVPNEEIDDYRLGASVTLDFNISGLDPVPAVITYINKDLEQTNSVVIFQCDYVNESLVNLRIAQADVNFKSVSGLRVSKSAIRYTGIEKGVYIIIGDKLVFRPINVIYEDVGFVLCQEYAITPETARSLQQFDEVVIEGMQLYDDKPIK